MILEDTTKEVYGYYSTDLMPHSCKPIIAVCAICGALKLTSNNDYRMLCSSCGEKGRVQSHVTRLKIADSLRGKKHSIERCQNKSNALQGNSNALGYVHTNEEKCKMREAQQGRIGEMAANWRGGASFKPYCFRFNFQLKEMIREQYNRKCFLCGKSEEENGRRLDVHHIDGNKQQGCNTSNWYLMPLCMSCHHKIHKKEYEL